ncbi:MAG: hypothetical protein ACT4ON_13545 [Bacteroidota bacterium]
MQNLSAQMYSDTTHENMILNIVSNVIAFLLGSIAVILHAQNNHPFISIQSIFTNPDNYIFIIKSIISGVVALAVKVIGELLIYRFKSKKQKEDQPE